MLARFTSWTRLLVLTFTLFLLLGPWLGPAEVSLAFANARTLPTFVTDLGKHVRVAGLFKKDICMGGWLSA